MQEFDYLGLAGARLMAAGLRLLLLSWRSIWCTWNEFGAAGAALVTHGLTLAWQARHTVYMELLWHGTFSTLCTWK